jgi:hypothetical protein
VGASGVAIGDVNGDGRNDVVVTFGGNSPAYIDVLYQQPNGALGPAVSAESYDLPTGVEIADMNNDGRLDIVVHHSGWNAVTVHLQQGDGTLARRERFGGNYGNFNPDGLAVGDINGDGFRDIVLAGADILINRTPILIVQSNASAQTVANKLRASAFSSGMRRSFSTDGAARAR